jgi:hypothetical protein
LPVLNSNLCRGLVLKMHGSPLGCVVGKRGQVRKLDLGCTTADRQ